MAASRLRVIGGTARGVPLAEPRGTRLRPTAGITREALFNIIGSRVEGARFLDLYAGTGAVGIEALSRGAGGCVFVESDANCCSAIVQSLGRLGLGSLGTVVRGRLPAALGSVQGPFDIVFMDPPYGDETAIETLSRTPSLVAADGSIVFEHASRYDPPERPAGLRLADRRVYGDSALAFYRPEEGV